MNSPPFISLIRQVNLLPSDPSWLLLHSGISHGRSYFPCLHDSSCGSHLNRTQVNGGLLFHALKKALESCFLGWHLLTGKNILIHCTQGDLLSILLSVRPLALNKELLSCRACRLDCLQCELSSGSIWGLKGLHQ